MSSKVILRIRHQCPGITLISPMYTGDDVVCDVLPDQSIDASSIMKTSFKMGLSWEEPHGILMYKLQRERERERKYG
jgi:hypothetical protein